MMIRLLIILSIGLAIVSPIICYYKWFIEGIS